MRAAKALMYLTQGYCQTSSEVIGSGIFADGREHDFVVVKDIEFHSLCEHHILPFYGKVKIPYSCEVNLMHFLQVHIAYITGSSRKVLGLSKLARVTNVFARRLQVQERLTHQIAEAIMEAVKPHGVAVYVEAAYVECFFSICMSFSQCLS